MSQDVFFWQNMPSHIQSPAIEVLAQRWSGDIHCVWAAPISPDRIKMSWKPPEMPNTTQHFLNNEDPCGDACQIIESHPDSIHILSGLEAYPAISAAFHHGLERGVEQIGLMVEPGIRMGWRGWLRPIRAKLLARKYLPRVRLVLAMGRAGVDFYRRAGFASQVLFPYMYQAPVSESPDRMRRAENNWFELIYVGKFSPRKGLDILIRSLANLKTPSVRLTIVGSGPEMETLRGLARELKVDAIIQWKGVLDHSSIIAELQRADLCVVPSRFEGWGVVVNEAIGQGVPVICSEQTSSRDLVEFGGCGDVFRSESADDLAEKIDRLLSKPKRLENAAMAAWNYRTRISPESVGGYLSDVLEHVYLGTGRRPSPPWETDAPHNR